MNESPAPKCRAARFAVCTADDLPALTELYLAAFPNANAQDLVASLSNTTSWWAALKSDHGDISVAFLVTCDGGVLVLIRPDQAESPAVKEGFLRRGYNFLVFQTSPKSEIRPIAVEKAAGNLPQETLANVGRMIGQNQHKSFFHTKTSQKRL